MAKYKITFRRAEIEVESDSDTDAVQLALAQYESNEYMRLEKVRENE